MASAPSLACGQAGHQDCPRADALTLSRGAHALVHGSHVPCEADHMPWCHYAPVCSGARGLCTRAVHRAMCKGAVVMHDFDRVLLASTSLCLLRLISSCSCAAGAYPVILKLGKWTEQGVFHCSMFVATWHVRLGGLFPIKAQWLVGWTMCCGLCNLRARCVDACKCTSSCRSKFHALLAFALNSKCRWCLLLRGDRRKRSWLCFSVSLSSDLFVHFRQAEKDVLVSSSNACMRTTCSLASW